MFSHLTTCKALFSLTNCHQKHQMPQHTKCNIITQWLITTKRRNTYFNSAQWCHFSSKALRKERQHVIFKFFFAHFQSQNYFYLHNTCVLTPWLGCQCPHFLFGTSPPGRWWRHLHHLRRGGGTSTTSGDDQSTTSSSLQKQETIS